MTIVESIYLVEMSTLSKDQVGKRYFVICILYTIIFGNINS